MAAYSKFLGHKVSVQYRANDILLPASGIFVGDSGRSIFLEQHLEQRGKVNYFRWEIPYRCINRLEQVSEPTDAATTEPVVSAEPPKPEPRANAAAASQTGSSGVSSFTVLPSQLPKSV
jgi:hypothetical protein